MVIYWFGFVDEVRDMSDGLLVADEFPLDLTVLHP